jgi:hypothetical protein
MRVLLRHRETGLYYAGDQRWKDKSEVFDFKTVEDATEEARAQGFSCTEVVLCYSNPDCDLVLPQRDFSFFQMD